MSKDDLQAKTSRRNFLKSAAPAAAPAFASARSQESRPSQGAHWAYVGTYSSPHVPQASPGRGRGIYLFEMDPGTGALTERAVFANHFNPTWLALAPSGTHLYCTNELDHYQGAPSGAVSAYAINPANGHLTLLNTVSSQGSITAHLSVHPSGKYVLAANYGSGTVAVLPVHSSGKLGEAICVRHDTGATGPQHAASGPRGSFAISGHERPGTRRAHMIQAAPSGPYVLSTDLGTDRIHVWKFDVATGQLSPHASSPLPPGDGPRHFAFHPNQRWLYSLQEEASTLALFHYGPARGTLQRKQMLSTLPPGFAGTNFSSEVRVSADGRFVYAANRQHDSVAVFAIGAEGHLRYEGETWSRGDAPRCITFAPAGDFLYALNRMGDAITTYRVDRAAGRLDFTGQYTPLGTPACMVFWR